MINKESSCALRHPLLVGWGVRRKLGEEERLASVPNLATKIADSVAW